MKKTPMKMMKEKAAPKKAADARPGKKKSAMERYADERNASIAMARQPAMMQHDPQTDVYHLQKAEEVRGDESRKRHARAHAAKTIKMMQKIMK